MRRANDNQGRHKEAIEAKAKMVRFTKELIEKIHDPRLKPILNLIHDDEVRHHRIPKALEKEMAEKETLAEADV